MSLLSEVIRVESKTSGKWVGVGAHTRETSGNRSIRDPQGLEEVKFPCMALKIWQKLDQKGQR